ncbi:heterogeneous nuclear ribonucleoprotein L-like [Tropilaelaps mercedesae]|uniref:Heterogeneous nuclear ribonucleoprotein L-like n=1 Tax=Tropilaelaps mercedesae TaxID=418985 RepID=A0A1V9XT13_9ACAR|nr:heterogeneous nuclear ribonucleoprotein L-like [Tropilaelaps mercedesae]
MPFDLEDGNGRAPKRQRTEPLKPNHIVLMTIRNALYPIDVEVVHKISSPLGRVQRIVIFRKNGVQALVEFESVEQATRARMELDGADIYQGCCTLKVEFAKPAKLNVYKNDKDTWDYTGCLDGKEKDPGRHKAALLGPPPMAGSNAFVGACAPSGLIGVVPGGGPPYGGAYDDGSAFNRNGRGSQVGQPQGGSRNGSGAYGAAPGGPDSAGFDYQHYGAAHGGQGGMGAKGGYGDRRGDFLRSKPGCAMVQMGDGASVERAVQNVHSSVLFDQTLQVNFSKQPFLHEEVKAYDLPDGTPSFREFSKSRNNRFSNSELAAKNRIRPPSNTLHFFNAPSDVTDERLRDVFTKEDLTPPVKVTMFENKNLKSQTGMLEFETIQQATEALVICNHAPIQSPASPFPFLLKLCFTSGSYPKHLSNEQGSNGGTGQLVQIKDDDM